MFFHQEAKRSRNERRSGWPPIPVISSRIEAELADKNVPLYGQWHGYPTYVHELGFLAGSSMHP